MSEILAYMPTYSPNTEAVQGKYRPYRRLTQDEIKPHLSDNAGRLKPFVYMDAIDSVLNVRPDIHLVVADGRSTESIRAGLTKHWQESGGYDLKLYPEKMSQWVIFNDIIKEYAHAETKYFVYTSSDVIWQMDWVAEAIKEFESDPTLMILFPTVNNGDANIPCQVAAGPVDKALTKAPYDQYGRAPVLNAYAVIFRMEFLRFWGGYPTLFRNCYTESFLHYLCEAMGGKMRLMPRGWCFHWGTVDIWQENGSFYHFNEENTLFSEVMNKVQMMHGARMMTPEFLKQTLWRQNA